MGRSRCSRSIRGRCLVPLVVPARLVLSRSYHRPGKRRAWARGWGLAKATLAVQNTRGIGKADMVLNAARPHIEVNPETYEVRADGVLLTCEPATELPLAQRYFLY